MKNQIESKKVMVLILKDNPNVIVDFVQILDKLDIPHD
jgi:hypothetical protein